MTSSTFLAITVAIYLGIAACCFIFSLAIFLLWLSNVGYTFSISQLSARNSFMFKLLMYFCYTQISFVALSVFVHLLLLIFESHEFIAERYGMAILHLVFTVFIFGITCFPSHNEDEDEAEPPLDIATISKPIPCCCPSQLMLLASANNGASFTLVKRDWNTCDFSNLSTNLSACNTKLLDFLCCRSKSNSQSKRSSSTETVGTSPSSCCGIRFGDGVYVNCCSVSCNDTELDDSLQHSCCALNDKATICCRWLSSREEPDVPELDRLDYAICEGYHFTKQFTSVFHVISTFVYLILQLILLAGTVFTYFERGLYYTGIWFICLGIIVAIGLGLCILMVVVFSNHFLKKEVFGRIGCYLLEWLILATLATSVYGFWVPLTVLRFSLDAKVILTNRQ